MVNNTSIFSLKKLKIKRVDDTQTKHSTMALYQHLHQRCLEAIEDGDLGEVQRILRTRTPSTARFQPTSALLAEALYHNHTFLVRTLLGFPYFVFPNEACLAYALKHNQHDLVKLFLKRYRVEPSEASLAYAISACNVPMVKYLIRKRGVPVHEDLYDDLYDDPEEADDFSPSERLARNHTIRRILRKAL